MLPAQRTMLGGVRLHLRAVERHLAQLQHPHLPRDPQNLHKQRAQLLEKPLAEVRYRVVIRMQVGRHIPKRHRIVRRPLQLPARKHPARVPVKQQRHHHRRWKCLRTSSPIPTAQFAQIQLLHNLDDKPRQVILRQPLLYRRRQQVRRIAVHVHKPSAHPFLPIPLEPLDPQTISYHISHPHPIGTQTTCDYPCPRPSNQVQPESPTGC